jgi:hypothetical protein
MNTDIRISLDLFSNIKIKRLMRALGHAGLTSLFRLWIYTAQRRSDGVLVGMDSDDIEAAADWDGEPGAFVETLVAVKLLDRDGGTYAIHDWEANNPWAAGAARRSEKARANANKRHGHQHATSMLVAESQHASGNAPSPSPSPNHVHVSTDVDAHAKVASLTGELPDLDDVLDVVIPGAKAEGVTKADAPRRRSYPAEFAEFWAAYPGPRRVDKANCLAKFNAILSSGVQVADLLAGLDAWKRSDDWSKDGGQFICAPLVWLNRRRWEDSPGGAASGSVLPVPGEIRDRPWVAVWMEKRGTQPEPLTVMNLATALGADPYTAEKLYWDKGLAAAGDWVWDSRKTG